MILSLVFVAAVALQRKFLLASKFFKKSWEHAKDSHTCFVDLGKVYKVYGRVPRGKLGVMFWEYGVDG